MYIMMIGYTSSHWLTCSRKKRRRKSNLNFPWLIATTNSYRVSGGVNLLPPSVIMWTFTLC